MYRSTHDGISWFRGRLLAVSPASAELILGTITRGSRCNWTLQYTFVTSLSLLYKQLLKSGSGDILPGAGSKGIKQQRGDQVTPGQQMRRNMLPLGLDGIHSSMQVVSHPNTGCTICVHVCNCALMLLLQPAQMQCSIPA